MPVPGPGPMPPEQVAQEQPEATEPLGAAGIQARDLALSIISRHPAPARPGQARRPARVLALSTGIRPRWAAGGDAMAARRSLAAEGLLRRAPLGLAHWRAYQTPHVPEEFSPVWREPRHEGNVPEGVPGQPAEGTPQARPQPMPRAGTVVRRLAAPLRRPGGSTQPAARPAAKAISPIGARSKEPMARVPSTSFRRRRPGVALHRPTTHVDRPMLSNIHDPIVSGSIEPVASPERWAAREYEHARTKPERQPTSVMEFLFGPDDAQSSEQGQSLRPRESSGPWEPPPSVPARPFAPRPAPAAGVAGPDASAQGQGPRIKQRPGPLPAPEDRSAPGQTSRGGLIERSRRLVSGGVALVFRKPATSAAGPVRPGPAPRPDVSAGGKAASEICQVPGPGRAASPGELSALRADVPRTESREAFHVQATGQPPEDSVSGPDDVHPAQAGASRRPRGLMGRAVEMAFARRQAPATSAPEGTSIPGAGGRARRAGHAASPRQPATAAVHGGEASVSRAARARGAERHQPGPAREVEERPLAGAPSTAPERPLRARAPEEATPTRGKRAGGPPASLVRRSLQVASRAREMVLRKPSLPATSAARTGEQPAPRQSRPGGPGATGRMAGRPAERRVTPPSPSTVRPQAADERPDADIRDTAPDVARSATGQSAPSWLQQAGQVPGGEAVRQRPGATRGQAEVAPSLDVQDASLGDWQRPRPALASQAPGRPSGILRRSVGLALRTRDLVFRGGASASPTAQPFPASSQRPAPARAGHRPRGDTGQGYDRAGVARSPRMPRVTRVARAVARRSVGMVLHASEMAFRRQTRDGHAPPRMAASPAKSGMAKAQPPSAPRASARDGNAVGAKAHRGGAQRGSEAAPRSVKLQASADVEQRRPVSRITRLQQAARRSATTVLHARELVFRKWTPSGVQSGRMDAHAVADSAARRASVQAREDASAQGSPLPRQAQAGFHAQHEGHAAEDARPLATQRRLSAPLMRSFSPRPVGRQAPAERRPEAAEWPVTPTPARGERRASPVRSGPVWLHGAGERARGDTSDVAEGPDRLPLATAPYRTPLEARSQARPPAVSLPAVHDARQGASSNGTVRRKVDARAAPASNGNGRLNGATPLPGPEHIQLAWQSARPSGSRREGEQPRPGEHRDGEQPAPELKPEQVELLASRIYSYIKQKLAMERERHGRPGFPLWP